MKVWVFYATENRHSNTLLAIDICSTEEKAKAVRDYWELNVAETTAYCRVDSVIVDEYFNENLSKLAKSVK